MADGSNLQYAPLLRVSSLTIDVDLLRPRLAAALGGQLQLGELLGVGGFAAVFRAHDPLLQRDVAIRVLDPGLSLTADLFGDLAVGGAQGRNRAPPLPSSCACPLPPSLAHARRSP